jgi:hypothetical protein
MGFVTLSRFAAVRNLRHSYGKVVTSLVVNDIHVTQKLSRVGHMSPKMTERYTRISSSAQRQAVELLDQGAEATPFVEVFVEKPESRQSAASKSLK